MSEPYDPLRDAQDRRASWRSLTSSYRGQAVAAQVPVPAAMPQNAFIDHDQGRAELGLVRSTSQGQAETQGQGQGQTQIPRQAHTQVDPRTEAIQRELDDTVGVMRHNINKIQERGEHLDSLSDKTDQLRGHSQMFKKSASDVRKRMWWKNMKWWLIIGAVLTVLIVGGVMGAIKGKEVVHIIDNKDSPVSPQPAASGSLSGQGLGPTGNDQPRYPPGPKWMPPPGAAPVDVHRRRVRIQRDIIKLPVEERDTRTRTVIRRERERKSPLTGYESEDDLVLGRQDDRDTDKLQGRSEAKRNPPPPDWEETDPSVDSTSGKERKRDGFIGVEKEEPVKRDHQPSIAETQIHAEEDQDEQTDKVEVIQQGVKLVHKRRQIQNGPRGRVLQGFGKRAADGKTWFLAEVQ